MREGIPANFEQEDPGIPEFLGIRGEMKSADSSVSFSWALREKTDTICHIKCGPAKPPEKQK